MSSRRIAIAALVAVACIGGALACGPFFPWQLLDNRDQTVAEPIGLGFTSEATRLVQAPRDRLRAVESSDPSWRSSAEPEVVLAEREEAEAGAWRTLMSGAPLSTDALLAKLAAARAAETGEAAMVAGAGLPVAVLTYIAGAIEFRADRFEAAARYFEAIDRLPTEQRQIRAVAAAYMLGRVHQRMGDLAAARTAFRAARRYVQEGVPDPMGLAVASLGEEARIDLVEAGLTLAPPPWPVPPVEGDDAKITRLIGDAVRLYAEQAARGSKMALLSLREVAGLLLSHEEKLTLAVADPLVRRLLVAYVVARDGQSLWDESVAGPQDPTVVQVIDAVLTQPAPADGPDLDRLATLAYQAGRYDLAERLTAATNRPLGLWVRAKLALRRGDRAAAVRDWTAALAGTEAPAAATTLDGPAETRLRGEAAVMKLSQGEYRESLRLLFPVANVYWGDVAYVAERVLTVDELKAFVDGLPPPPSAPQPKRADDDWSLVPIPVDGLRALLARRLVREGRIAEAFPYFASTPAAPATDRPPLVVATADEARAYLAALEAARSGQSFTWPWQRVVRAEAWFTAARMARNRGMELMGTEGPPDEAALDGSFPAGIGQSSPNGISETPSKLLGPDEAKRFAASAPKPDVRFHYRVIATDHALAAADDLPQRSQAYAAVLCWATRYAFASSDEARASAIYQRYVKTGAYQAWATAFGRECPEPDFEAARSFWPRRIAAWPREIAGSMWRHPALAVGASAIALALLAGAIWTVRTRRNRPGPA